jgi:nucleoside-diphosphate-sugar epimerase
MRLLVFGFGFSAEALTRLVRPQGWEIAGTFRDEADEPRLRDASVEPVALSDAKAIADETARADAILVTAPPGPNGCPALPVLIPALAKTGAFPGWIGYLSTTGVYGDRRGGWVTEKSRLAAQSVEGARRVAAERDWLQVGAGMGLSVAIFRLPGIYGPGRSPFDRLRSGKAKRIVAPGQVFSRIHVDDLAAGLTASIARPRPGGIYNLCDDEPAPNSEVLAYAARLIGIEPPPEIPLDLDAMAPAARRFYAESKRVSNALAKAELGWRPAYPTYREGLQAVLAAGG